MNIYITFQQHTIYIFTEFVIKGKKVNKKVYTYAINHFHQCLKMIHPANIIWILTNQHIFLEVEHQLKTYFVIKYSS